MGPETGPRRAAHTPSFSVTAHICRIIKCPLVSALPGEDPEQCWLYKALWALCPLDLRAVAQSLCASPVEFGFTKRVTRPQNGFPDPM